MNNLAAHLTGCRFPENHNHASCNGASPPGPKKATPSGLRACYCDYAFHPNGC